MISKFEIMKRIGRVRVEWELESTNITTFYKSRIVKLLPIEYSYLTLRQQIPRTLEKLGKPFEMCWFGETLFPLVNCAQISLN